MDKKLIDKKAKKKLDGKCTFCPECDYDVLDVHRILDGQWGGRYVAINCVTACACCHRRIHAGTIQILGKHYSTSGRYVVIYMENGEEKMAYT